MRRKGRKENGGRLEDLGGDQVGHKFESESSAKYTQEDEYIRFKEKERNHVLWDDAECTLTNETSGATRDRVISYLNLRCHAHVEEKGREMKEEG